MTVNTPLAPAWTAVVGVVHQSPVVGRGLIELLDGEPWITVAGLYAGANEVVKDPPPEGGILIYDLPTAHAEGGAALMEVHSRFPSMKLLMFDVPDDDRAVIECVQAGASGCIFADASVEEVLGAIRSLAEGTPPASARVVTTLFRYVASLQKGEQPAVAPVLTAREEQILQMMAEGLTNREIAKKLFLQPQTVKNYVHIVLQKMDMRSRLDVIRRLRSQKPS
jgi:DNA-binding NarL/FixJ family response regulator